MQYRYSTLHCFGAVVSTNDVRCNGGTTPLRSLGGLIFFPPLASFAMENTPRHGLVNADSAVPARFWLPRSSSDEIEEKPAPSILACARPAGLLLIVVIALGLGLGLAHWHHDTAMEITSACLGWAYFACWSLSFYPQPIQNWERKSVVGLSFDYAVLNVIGFGCYSAFNLCLLYAAPIRAAYARAHGGHASAVRVNDAFFAVHALILSSLLIVQIGFYPRGNQRVSRVCLAFCLLFVLLVPVPVVLAARGRTPWCDWLTVLYMLSYVKLGISVCKYLPQVYLNAARRSTDGWNMDNVVLDFAGGLLSLCQLVLDAVSTDDWSAVTGDPVKFGLGLTSMIFDTIFALQHWVCYRKRRAQADDDGYVPYRP